MQGKNVFLYKKINKKIFSVDGMQGKNVFLYIKTNIFDWSVYVIFYENKFHSLLVEIKVEIVFGFTTSLIR